MAQFPALPLWSDAFIADTTHLSAEETGGYLMLLMCAWRRPDCDLPDDDVLLQRWSRIDARRWPKVRDRIMSFWTLSDGRWTQKRLIKEHEYVSHRRSVLSANAKAKHLKNKKIDAAIGEQNACKIEAPTPTPISLSNDKDPPTPRKRGSDRKTAIAEDWSPSDDDRSYASSLWSDWTARTGLTAPDLQDEAERFRLHHLSAGKRMTDWSAAWKTWVRNAAKFLGERERQRPGSVPAAPRHDLLTMPAPAPPAETDDVWRERAADYRARGNWRGYKWGPDLLSRDCRVPPHLRSLFTQGEPP